jgi:hypothetical protein
MVLFEHCPLLFGAIAEPPGLDWAMAVMVTASKQQTINMVATISKAALFI